MHPSNSKLMISHEDIERCAGRDDVVACQQSMVQSACPVMDGRKTCELEPRCEVRWPVVEMQHGCDRPHSLKYRQES